MYNIKRFFIKDNYLFMDVDFNSIMRLSPLEATPVVNYCYDSSMTSHTVELGLDIIYRLGSGNYEAMLVDSDINRLNHVLILYTELIDKLQEKDYSYLIKDTNIQEISEEFYTIPLLDNKTYNTLWEWHLNFSQFLKNLLPFNNINEVINYLSLTIEPASLFERNNYCINILQEEIIYEHYIGKKISEDAIKEFIKICCKEHKYSLILHWLCSSEDSDRESRINWCADNLTDELLNLVKAIYNFSYLKHCPTVFPVYDMYKYGIDTIYVVLINSCRALSSKKLEESVIMSLKRILNTSNLFEVLKEYINTLEK